MTKGIYRPINSVESNLNIIRFNINFFEDSETTLYENDKFLAIGSENYNNVSLFDKIDVLESPNFNLLPRYFSVYVKNNIFYINFGIKFISIPTLTVKIRHKDTNKKGYKVVEVDKKLENFNNRLLVNPNDVSSYNYAFKIVNLDTGNVATVSDNLQGFEVIAMGNTALGLGGETVKGLHLLYDAIDASSNIIYSFLPIALGKHNATKNTRLDVCGNIVVEGTSTLNRIVNNNSKINSKLDVSGNANIHAVVDLSGFGGKINDVNIGLTKDQSGFACFKDVSVNKLTAYGKITTPILEVTEIKYTYQRTNVTQDFVDDKDLDVEGAIDLQKTFSVRGESTFRNNIFISGNSNVTGNYDITGNSNITGNYNINGNSNVTGNYDITGDSNITGNYDITGNSRVTGDYDISGNSNVTGNYFIHGNHLITGDSFITGNYEITGDSKVTGDYDITGNSRVTGNYNILGNSDVTGIQKITGDTFITGNHDITGTHRITGNHFIVGDIDMSGNSIIIGNYDITGNNNITGNYFILGDSKITGNHDITGDSRVTGNYDILGNNYITGFHRITGNNYITGNYDISGNSIVIGNYDITGDTNYTGSHRITGDSFITGNNDLSGNNIIVGNVDITGDTTITGILNVTGKYGLFSGVHRYNDEGQNNLISKPGVALGATSNGNNLYPAGNIQIIGESNIKQTNIGWIDWIDRSNTNSETDRTSRIGVNRNYGFNFETTDNSGGLAERVRISNDGNVGIGTTNPRNKLDIEGSLVVGSNYSGSEIGPRNGLLVEGNVGIGNINPDFALDVSGEAHISSNLRVGGNLTIEGSLSTIHSTNTVIKDQLIELGNGSQGTPMNDSGIIIERGSLNNTFIGWDESEDTFIMATTSATGDSSGNLDLNPGTLHIGKLGIGTSSPGTMAQIEGKEPFLTFKNTEEENRDGGSISKIIFENSKDLTMAYIQTSHAGNNNDPQGEIVFGINNGSEIEETMKLDSSGNIGMGTDNPREKLHIEGESTNILIKNTKDRKTDGTLSSKIIFEDNSSEILAQIQTSHAGENNDSQGELVFSTNDGFSLNERLKIDSSGNVGVKGSMVIGSNYSDNLIPPDDSLIVQSKIGIGNSNPCFELDVSGDGFFSNNLRVRGDFIIDGSLTTINTTNTIIKDQVIELGNGTEGLPVNDSGIIIERGSLDNKFIGWDEGNDTFIMASTKSTGDSSGNMDFTPDTLVVGKLGVGTSNPETIVQIEGTEPFLSLKNTKDENEEGSAKSKIMFKDHINATIAQIEASHAGINDDTQGELIFATNSGEILKEVMRLDSSGNVGIGTNDPKAKLHIEGSTSDILIKNTTKNSEDGKTSSRITFQDDSDFKLAGIEVSHAGNISDGQGQFSISTNNGSSLVEVMKIDSSGNVDINGTVLIGSQYSGSVLTPNDSLLVQGSIGIGNTKPDFELDVSGDGHFSNDLHVGGDLIVKGSLTTINSTNTVIKDQIIELGTGIEGNPENDSGLIINRGEDTNAFIGWDESEDTFIMANTHATGDSTGDLNLTPGTLHIGKIGVGTSNPETIAQIEGSEPFLTLKNTTDENKEGSAKSKILFKDHISATIAQIEASHAGIDDDTQGELIFSTNSGTTLQQIMKLDSSGNVGIGTNNPKAKLHIEGSTPEIIIRNNTKNNTDGSKSSNILFEDDSEFKLAGIEVSHAGNINDGQGQFSISTNNGSSLVEVLKIDSSGNVDVNGSVLIGSQYSGTLVTPADSLLVQGRIGVGNTNPDQELDVSGHGHISKDLYVDGDVTVGKYGHFGENLNVDGDFVVKGNLTSNKINMNDSLLVQGKIGVGNTNPNYELDVSGDGHFSKNLHIDGDFFVNGTLTTIDSTNTVIKDQILELGTGTTGTPQNDSGIIIERGDDTNAFIGWDESEDEFIMANTNANGNSTGNLTLTPGTLHVGDVKATSTLIGYVGHTGYAGFMNSSLSTDGTNYALLQATTGHTFLNSSTGKDIRFRVNNSDQMILKSDGDFGIGTTSPQSKLDVNDSIRGAYNSNTTSYFGRSAVGYAGYDDMASFAHIDNNNTTDYALLQDSNGFTFINAKTAKQISFRLNNVDKMVLVASGNVGIGTTSPQSKLDVEGGVAIGSTYSGTTAAPSNGMIVEGNVGIGTNNPSFALDVNGIGNFNSTSSDYRNLIINSTATSGNASNADLVFSQSGVDKWNLYYQTSTGNFNIDDKVNNERALTIKAGSDTKIGINNSNPDFELDVSGTGNFSSDVKLGGDLTLKNFNEEYTEGGRESNILFKDFEDKTMAQIKANNDGKENNGDLIFLTNNNTILGESMRIDSQGFVGINTNDPDFELDVSGTGNFTHVNFNGTLKQNGTELNLTPLSDFDVKSDVSMNSLYLGHIPTTTTTTAQYNVAVGETALKSIAQGNKNTSIGFDSLYYNTTGSSNISVGYQSILNNKSGSNNVGVGVHSLKRLVSGDHNIGIGKGSLAYLNNGTSNIAIGSNGTGSFLETGNQNIIIGFQANVDSTSAENRIVIGVNANGNEDNVAVIGNSDITKVYMAQDGEAVMYADGTINTSDKRLKEDIQTTKLGLDFINKLNPVSYKWNNKDDNRDHEGLIAQEVESVINELKLTKENHALVEYTESKDIYRLAYTELIGPLIKSVQELDKIVIDEKTIGNNKVKELEVVVQEQQKTINNLNSKVENMEQQIALLISKLEDIQK